MGSIKQTLNGLTGSGPRLAWLGLGNMGRGMVTNIVAKGTFSSLLIYNRTTARANKFAATLNSDKVKVATSIHDAVEGADIIFMCLGDDKSVEDNIATCLEAPSASEKLFVDCSTVHPETSNKVAKTVTATGAKFVSCPVFGAPSAADAGDLVVVLAGPKEQVERVRPFAKGVIGRAEIDFSDQPHGTATHLKIIGNTFVLNLVESIAEGHVLAEKSGLGSENLHKFIEAMFPGPYTAYSNRMKGGVYYKREEPLFAVDLALKDANHALDLASKSGAKLPDIEVAKGRLLKVKEHQGEKGDIAGIYGAIRAESGLSYEV